MEVRSSCLRRLLCSSAWIMYVRSQGTVARCPCCQYQFLLAYSHTPSFMYCLHLLSLCNFRVESLQQAIWSTKQKRFASPHGYEGICKMWNTFEKVWSLRSTEFVIYHGPSAVCPEERRCCRSGSFHACFEFQVLILWGCIWFGKIVESYLAWLWWIRWISKIGSNIGNDLIISGWPRSSFGCSCNVMEKPERTFWPTQYISRLDFYMINKLVLRAFLN